MYRKLVSLIIFFTAVSIVHSLTITSVQVLDSNRNTRTSFSNTETITMKIDCIIDAAVERVDFKFYIYDPAGMQVFYHEGNSMVGRVGLGGSELRNMPITFYTKPGEYTLKGEVIPVTGAAISKTTKFSIYSANISLTYPPNGATDMLAQPLIFRWVASGAPKYKVYVDDDASFYKPLWTGETITSEIEYPRDPTDPLAKLRSGTVYWWKVEGLDVSGRVVARTPIPFSFSIKEQTLISRDLSIETISLSELSTDDFIKIDVYIKNLGNQPEAEITVDFVIAGGNIVGGQKVSTIAPGQTQILTFDCGKVTGEVITVSATLNFYDDNPKNNILTKVIKLTKEKAKILGGVTEEESKKPIGNATVAYTGPVSGSVKTNSGGQYKIENLPLGKYELKVAHENYEDSETKVIELEKNKAYPNVDFELEMKEEKEEKIPELTLDEIWLIIKSIINDKKLEKDLEGYRIIEIELEPSGDIPKLIYELKNNKANIREYKLE